ncbi:uncharacterized protein At4g26485-like isoform X2 [Telopea speciosissima]|uniref:uncharacterized protein At4g26485-like isoform X2 n=1 Tax=Telopea speciosissima TaxID=54955 RepID=UPI001CC4364A|nr:uncharacterized protein At4g26485-like isoform X2 [Telopea speciosissima]
MGQVLSNLISILFGRKKKVKKISDEENGYQALADCEEVKSIHPSSDYGNTRVSEEDEEAVVFVISDSNVREDVDPSPPPPVSCYQKTRISSEDERVTIIVDNGVEAVKKIKPILHLSTADKIRVPKDGLGAKKTNRRVLQKEKRIKHYFSSHKILLVGEGDFSFSACLVKVFGSAANMVATSLNSEDFLKKNYSNAMSNINDLKSRGCMVLHGIDATNMSGNQFLKGMRFDRIVFNFPYAGFFKQESRESQLSRHQKLVTLFFKNAKKMLSEDGEIHVSHKSNGFHSEWNIVSLASLSGLNFIKEVKFNVNSYQGYNTKRGFGGDENFDCNPSQTYMFGLG